jgi:hypothetical protein
MFVKNVLDSPRSADVLGDKLENAEKPWHCEQSSKRPECEPKIYQFMLDLRVKDDPIGFRQALTKHRSTAALNG